MSFPQLGYPQYLSATQAAYGSERTGVLAGSTRGSASEISASPSATTAAVTSVLGMYANPYAAHNYSAFLPYTSADLALISQMGSQYELKDNPGAHPASFATHTSPAFFPYGQYQYGDPARAKSATRETTSTLKAWLQEHKKNPYPTKGEKIMLAIITKMTLTQVSTWFANARRRLKKENKVTWGRSAEDRDGKIFDSDNEGDAEKNEDEEIDLESIDIDKIDENNGDHSNDEEDKLDDRDRMENVERSQSLALQAHQDFESKYTISTSKERAVAKIRRVPSPHGQGSCQLPANNKPKIWSLAETATSPDSPQKSALSNPTSQASTAIQHPAFLSNHGIYTCQIGKLHNWTNAAFLGQNSLSNVKSFLGVDHGHHYYNHNAQALQHPTSRSASSVAAGDSENSSECLSPKHIDQENPPRTPSPTQTIKSSFVHESTRNRQESSRVLTTLTST